MNQYWSATVYDGTTHALLRNTQWSSRASTSADLTVNADGSVDIFWSDGTGRCINELGSDQGLQHFRGDLPVLRSRSSTVRQDVEASRYREASSLVDPFQVPPPLAVAQQQRLSRISVEQYLGARGASGLAVRSHHRSSTGHGPAHQDNGPSCRER